jgi:hypothetical protein
MYLKLKPAKKRWGLGSVVDDSGTGIVDCMVEPNNPICGNPATANLSYGYEGAAVMLANQAAAAWKPSTPSAGYGPTSPPFGPGGEIPRYSINPSYLLYGGVGLLGLMILMKAGRR